LGEIFAEFSMPQDWKKKHDAGGGHSVGDNN